MKIKRLQITCLLSFLLITSLSSKAQLSYYEASNFPLLGKISRDTETLYERLPKNLRDISRTPVWNLGKNTAGFAIRFSTNASTIGAKWEVKDGVHMNHMTDIGVKGLDLYCWEGDRWVFVNSARPKSNERTNETTIVANMVPQQREYMLYLPLYDGLLNLEIGVNANATIQQPLERVVSTKRPILAYGTSILQGGCASRPGMAHTNILSRWLNTEIINLGFSGNGKLDYEIAEIMGAHEASLYILDFMPNVDAQQVNEKLEEFYSIIRSKAPNTPIVFVENPIFPQASYDRNMMKVIEEKNIALNKIYHQLRERDSRISLVSSKEIIGLDNEATVDGIHFTDLGFMRYAEYLYPILSKQLNNE